MKKNILAIAIATAVAAPAAMADAKIYGYFNGALEMATDRGQQMDSRNSRIGIKGSEDLGNGLSAIYQFESGFNLFEGRFNDVRRNTFLGLNGGFGTVLFGRHDTPLRMIQPADAFADGKYTGNNRSDFNGGLTGEDRLDNVLAYISPNFEGFQFALAGSTAQGTNVQDEASITNAISASVAYGKKSDGLYLAAGYTSVDYDNDLGANVADRNNIRLTAQYRADGLTAYGMYHTEDNAGNEASSITLGASYKVGDFTPKLKVAMVDLDHSDKDGTNIAAGVDYNLGKSTKAFFEVASLSKDVFAGGVADDITVISLGMNHKF